MTGRDEPPAGGTRTRMGRRGANHRALRRRRILAALFLAVLAGAVAGVAFARALPGPAGELVEALRAVIAGWLGPPRGPEPEPARPSLAGGIHVEGLAAGEPSGLNPLLFLDHSSRQVAPLLFAGLTRLDGVGNVLPDLALSWEAAPGNSVWTFRLRPNAVWHDGRAVNARDVTFTLNGLASPDFPGDLAGAWRGVRASYPDDLTVVVELPAPDASFPVMAAVPILPRHILASVPFRSWYEHEFTRQPVGSGPFVLAEWEAGRHLTLAANKAYHLGAPELAAISLRFAVAAGPGAGAGPGFQGTVFGLAAGAFGGADPVAGGLVDPAAVTQLAGRRDLEVQRYPGAAYAAVLFNQRHPGGSEAVRRAIAAAVDLSRVAEAARSALVASGLGPGSEARNLAPYFVVGGPALPDGPAAAGQPAEVRRDAALAGRILAEAGWRDTDGDGVVERGTDSLRLRLVLPAGRPDLTAAGEELARQLGGIGIAVELEAVRPDQYLAAWGPPFEFDLLLIELSSRPDGSLHDLLHSSRVPWRGAQGELRGGANIAGVADAGLDVTLDALAAAPLSDAEQRSALHRTLAARLAEQSHVLVLWREAAYYAHANSLQGPAPGPFSLYWNVHQWRQR